MHVHLLLNVVSAAPLSKAERTRLDNFGAGISQPSFLHPPRLETFLSVCHHRSGVGRAVPTSAVRQTAEITFNPSEQLRSQLLDTDPARALPEASEHHWCPEHLPARKTVFILEPFHAGTVLSLNQSQICCRSPGLFFLVSFSFPL